MSIETKLQEGIDFFKQDESYFEYFKDVEIVQQDVLVKLCIVTPKVENKKGKILLPDAKTGVLKASDEVRHKTIFPVVKVIKVGASVPAEIKKVVKQGGIFSVSGNEVLGNGQNPDFHLALQTSDPNSKKIKATKDVPEYIPNLYINWNRYRFMRPFALNEIEGVDGEVYLIPWNKLKTGLK